MAQLAMSPLEPGNINQDDAESRLLTMLQYMRPAGSRSERKFINRFIRPLGVTQDAAGNLIKRIGDAPTVLWSSHTDTVHRRGGRQLIAITGDTVTAPDSDCLGADCTTGVWLMCEMVRLGVPGLYVWHREEEVGGLGSSYIATKTPGLLEGIKYAIAFDRYGKSSVITHQGSRCCSDDFAESLIAQLGNNYVIDTGGTFTDTANYTELVGECSNISVGYFNQHRHTESQSIDHALWLLERMACLDVSKLASTRKPGDPDDYGAWYYNRYYRAANATGRSSAYAPWNYDHEDYTRWDDAFSKADAPIQDDTKPLGGGSASSKRSVEDLDHLVDLCSEHPDAAAMLLQDLGISAEDLLSYIYNTAH